MSRAAKLALGLGLAALAGLACKLGGLTAPAAWTAAITTLCAVWWVTEPIPIPATSILPFALFPLTGVLDHGTVAQAYGHTLILLLLGGFMLSTAMEKSGAHRRIAFLMLHAVGAHGRRHVVLGFMLATAALSMWISNTATVLMMLPVAIAVLEQDEDGHLGVPLLLGVAYAASIGGLGTPVGTPPNVIFMGVYREQTGMSVGFAKWMLLGVPAVALFIPLAWMWLTRGLERGGGRAEEEWVRRGWVVEMRGGDSGCGGGPQVDPVKSMLPFNRRQRSEDLTNSFHTQALSGELTMFTI